MAHVGVQRLATRHTQHHGPQDDEGDERLRPDELQCVKRVQRPQDGRVGGNVVHPQNGNHGKPHQRDGAEKFANAAGATFLHHKQEKQDHQRERHHKTLEGG